MDEQLDTVSLSGSEIADLRAQLAEALETLEAIRTGAVDAIVVSDEKGGRIYTLENADYNYRLMAENMNEGAVVINRDGIIIFGNKAFADLAETESKRLVGTKFIDLIPENARPGYASFIDVCSSANARREFNIRAKSSIVPVSVSCMTFRASGQTNLCFIISDLRERKEAEKKLQDAYAEVEEIVRSRTVELRQAHLEAEQRSSDLAASNKELESFSFSISHDLRAPLRAIKSFSDFLLQDYMAALDPQAQDYLARIAKNADRMNKLIEDMLKLSRISRHELVKMTIDLSDVANMAVSESRQAEPERKIEIVIADHMRAFADKGLMKIAFTNLISNAWKYTSRNPEPSIEVGVTTDSKGNKAYFVRDNGVGFDTSLASKLFLPFQRLHTEGEFPGSGIGLAIVHRIMQRHGGRVWADAEIDKGATFYFMLPQDPEEGR